MKNSNLNQNRNNCEIAVVGVGCIYPGAKSPLQFWENILARRQQFREMPDERLPSAEYYDPDSSVPDKSYQKKAAVLDDFHFDWLEKRIPKGAYESTDIVHWLALETALQALKDSGIKLDDENRGKAGVILGNSLTGEFTRSNNMRTRWPYVRKALRASLKAKGLENIQGELEEVMEQYYKSVFAPVTEDSLAGGLANTIAGRVCNFLDIHGGGYTVDGACSSSLLAITNAANALELGQMDIAIAGGVDISLDTFELIGFAKTGALTKSEMRVYDKRGAGFIPGEGCGVVVLKRMEDAVRDKDTIYATIKGWGISSDGKGGITAPSAIGQSTALKRAYDKAGFDPSKLSFIEGHGTGTTVGDRIELEGISIALAKQDAPLVRSCGVTSLKSIIGHTKAAAGIGAFIKTVIALNRRVLPPTAGLEELNPIFEGKAKAIYPILNGQVMSPDSTLYAGVSAMGFGGINSHVLIQSGDQPNKKFQPALDEALLMVSNQTHELFLFAAEDKDRLIKAVKLGLNAAKGISIAELVDFASSINSKVDKKLKYRACVIAGTPDELLINLKVLIDSLVNANIDVYTTLQGDTISWGPKKDKLKIGGLFPGQGSQRINMAAKVVKRQAWAKDLVQMANEIAGNSNSGLLSNYIFKQEEKAESAEQQSVWKDELRQTNIAQPAITLASLIWKKHLENLGLELSAVTGHSLGELMAFQAAGMMSEETLLNFASFRGQQMSACGSGTMASLVCSREEAEKLIAKVSGYAVIANLNSPMQTVVSGEEIAISAIVESAASKGIMATKLPVSAAFHSKLIGDAASAILQFNPFGNKTTKKDSVALISSVNGREITGSTDLNEYFANQTTDQVKFVEAIDGMQKHCDVFVEIGPGKVLTGLASSIQSDVKCFPVEAKPGNDASLQIALGNLFVMGLDLKVAELYAKRLVREFVPAAEKSFLVNPCEKPFPEIVVKPSAFKGTISTGNTLPQLNIPTENNETYWSQRSNFVQEMILADMKHFSSNGKSASINTIVETVLPSTNEPVKQVIKVNEVESVQSIVYNEIQKVTGFPKESFTPDLKLLDDFNLDSIKAGSVLNTIVKHFSIQGKMQTATFANASLEDIIAEINKYYTSVSSDEENAIHTESESIENAVYSLVAAKTGFPEDKLSAEYRLLDDLNLDSIKAGSLLAELIKKYGLQGQIEASAHANSSLQEIISTIKEKASPVSSSNLSSSNGEQKIVMNQPDVEKIVFSLVAEKTGFPEDRLSVDYRLLDDLNLDSIKAGSLLAELIKKYGLQGQIEASAHANSSLQEIILTIKEKAHPVSSSNGEQKTVMNQPDIDKVVFSLVSEKTGFPEDRLSVDYRLLDDLNLDSIKAGSLLAELIKKYDLQGQIEASAHANSSLKEIISTIELKTSLTPSTAQVQSVAQINVEDDLYAQIEEKTGFPKEALKADFKLLDDLNLDSIKANSVLTTFFKQHNLLGKVEVSKYANASIAEIINVVKENVSQEVAPVQSETTIEIEDENPVYSYSVVINADAYPVLEEDANYWSGKRVAIVSAHKEDVTCSSVYAAIRNKASLVDQINYQSLSGLDKVYDQLIIVMPHNLTEDDFNDVVKLFACVAEYSFAKNADLTFVQFNDGYFGKSQANIPSTNALSAAGFASSLHLERPDSSIGIIEFEETLSQVFVVDHILREVSLGLPFNMVGYNQQQERITLEYERADASSEKRTSYPITESDVFLITGGAKGITAECALALAKKYKCKMALVGSSPYNGGAGEIADTLAKYKSAGLVANYYACNISDLSSTQQLVKQIEAELGTVTGVVHGAGRNVPRRSEMVSYEEAIKEISPKVKGAENLCKSINSDRLHYFVALTSIIGVTGMAGNSWYAFSNEWLDLYLRQIKFATNIETLALAYSVWSEVGMGERMGSTKVLEHMGIGAIPPNKGVDAFMRWIDYKASDQQLVIASHLGGLDTWKVKENEANKQGRYLENIIDFKQGVSLKVRSKLNEQTDLYTVDHDYKGSLLFPTVFGLEAMAQAVALLTGKATFKSLALENISLLRPIVVPNGGETEIEVNAVVQESSASATKVQVGISTEDTNFSVDHFSAVFVFDDSTINTEKVAASDLSNPLALEPISDLYSWLLFQGPRFRLIDRVYEMNANKAVFKTKNPGNDGSKSCLSAAKAASFTLGNPLLRDVLLQSVQLSLTKKLVLPIGIKRWEFFNVAEQVNGGEVRCQLTNWNENEGLCDVLYVNDNNEVIERITGYKVKAMQPTETYPEPETFKSFAADVEAKIGSELNKYNSLVGTMPEVIVHKQHSDFHHQSKDERRLLQDELYKQHITDRSQLGLSVLDNTLAWNEDGKPSLSNTNIDVSVSHCNSLLLMCLGEGAQGCDIELVANRNLDDWKALFDQNHSTIINNLIDEGVDANHNQTCTRIWGAREASAKAFGALPEGIEVLKRDGEAVIFQANRKGESIQVVTVPVELLPNNTYVISLSIKMNDFKNEKPATNLVNIDDIFEPISRKFICQFYTTFKDCKGFFGKTYFTDFPHWMGNLREYILTPVKDQLLKDLGSGEFGMVTNDSAINVYNEASTLDKITGRLWLTDKCDLPNSFMDLGYEWYRHNPDGTMDKLADCVLSTTWVKIEDRGIVKLSPIPDYFYKFLESHLKLDKNMEVGAPSKKFLPQTEDLGEKIYASQSLIRPEILISTKTYHTGISNSNTVGNLYYSNYYDWQAKTFESYIFDVAPDTFLKDGRQGEYICIKSNTNHLQEAMPFEDIEVKMYVDEVYECGVKMYFEFFSVGANHRRKLAYGSNTFVWAHRPNDETLPKAMQLPEVIKQSVLAEVRV